MQNTASWGVIAGSPVNGFPEVGDSTFFWNTGKQLTPHVISPPPPPVYPQITRICTIMSAQLRESEALASHLLKKRLGISDIWVPEKIIGPTVRCNRRLQTQFVLFSCTKRTDLGLHMQSVLHANELKNGYSPQSTRWSPRGGGVWRDAGGCWLQSGLLDCNW